MQGQPKFKGVQQPMTSKEYIEKVRDGSIETFLDEEGGLIIMPDKGIVMKYFDRHSGEKIFVNVVKHPGVDHPEEKLLIDHENQPGLRIPMSMGRVREGNDKSTFELIPRGHTLQSDRCGDERPNCRNILNQSRHLFVHGPDNRKLPS